MITGFWHIGVPVRNMADSLRFYVDGLGLELRGHGRSGSSAATVWGAPDDTACEVQFLGIPGEGDLIELLDFDGDDAADKSGYPWDTATLHFALYVDDLGAVWQKLTGMGYRARSSDIVHPVDGLLKGGSVAYFIDPNGVHVELVQKPGA